MRPPLLSTSHRVGAGHYKNKCSPSDSKILVLKDQITNLTLVLESEFSIPAHTYHNTTILSPQDKLSPKV